MKKILIAEDDPVQGKVLVEAFSEEGFSVILKNNGKLAMEAFHENVPDVVILDLLMPEVGGIAMLKEIRDKEEYKNIPVIVLTNMSGESAIAETVTYGINDFLVKGQWKLEDIVLRVKERLGV